MLLASGPAGAAPASGDNGASTQIDASTLLYSERDRTTVFEPTVRVTRWLQDGQSFSAQVAIDAMTGASPTGAAPSSSLQTTTSASGTTTTEASKVPVSPFRDLRGVLDLDWQRPLGLLTATTGAHVSREKDYQSLGANEKISVDVMQRLTTLTLGAGYNGDEVFPVGGTPLGLSDGSVRSAQSNSKRVTSVLVGVSRVLTRRWLTGITASHTLERGYLTEPYKIVSLLDSLGAPAGQLTENRPEARDRTSLEASSAYHLATDVVYSSYRYYWDDWGVRSHTIDFKYRRELQDQTFIQPHVRLYSQTAADFFTTGLPRGTPPPRFASADSRLGALRTATLGGTYGFHVPKYPGEFTLRVEYIHQWGKGDRGSGEGEEVGDDEGGAGAATRTHPAIAPLDIGTVVVGYSVGF